MRHVSYAALLIMLLASPSLPQTTRVLWCGNSYTDAGNVFSMVEDMVNCDTCGVAETLTLQVEPEMWASANLEVHWNGRGAGAMIDTGHYDYVLLQDMQGNVNWEGGRQQICQYTDSFCVHIRARGGEAISFQNWVWETATLSTWLYHKAFWDSVTAVYGTIMMPAGLAWWNGRQERPDLEWFDPGWNDGNHPGRAGAYLNACVAFATFTGVSPIGQKWRLIESWANTYVPPDEALFLQTKAWEAYQFYQTRPDTASPSVCTPSTIFTDQTPASFNNDRSYELGTKFKVSCSGAITTVRIYASATESGPHAVRIWRVSDASVLSGPHTWEITAGQHGWREYVLPTPLPVGPGADYIVSVSTGTGNAYPVATNGFLERIVNGSIATYAASGLFSSTPGAMPSQSYSSTNYFRDVRFEPSSTEAVPPRQSELKAAVDNGIAFSGSWISVCRTGDYSVRIFDAGGKLRLVLRGNAPARYSMAGLEPGAYVSVLTAANAAITRAFVKM